MAVKKERTKKRSHRRIKKGLLFILICAAVIGIVVYSPIFTVREIAVSGNNYLTKNDIAKISGVYLGEPLFQMDTVLVTKRLMKDLRIEEASVRRSLPATLSISIKERAPMATIASDYGYLDLDRQGKVIDSYLTLKKMPIPMITGMTLHDMYIGDDTDDKLIKNILFFLQQLDANALNQISEIAIISPDYIVAYTTKSVQIRLGKLERLEEKAKLTEDFLDDLSENNRPIEFIDFNYTAPFVKLAQ